MTTIDVPISEARTRRDRRKTLLARSAAVTILGSTLLYALYLIILAPPAYHTTAAFTIRGSQPASVDALSALGVAAPSSTSADIRIVEHYIRSHDMVRQLREDYGFEDAYSRFTLDPFSYLSPNATSESATAFWRGRVQLLHDTNAGSTTVHVSAFTPEDALRLTQGVLTISETLVNQMSDRATQDLAAASQREIDLKRQEYEAARERLTEYQGRRFSGVDAATPAQQAMALVGTLDAELAQKRTELATASQTFQPDAPQLLGLRREIAALESERERAVRRITAPGEQAAGSQIEAQAVLMDYEISQQAYQSALLAAESARRQDITDRKYVVSYVQPAEPQRSNWWGRLGNVFAVLIGSSIIWGVGALIYSIIRDHVE